MFGSQNKDDIRAEAIRARERIDVATDNPEDAALLFKEHFPDIEGKIIAGYWPKGREFDCRPILDDVLQGGAIGALPVVQKDSRVLLFAEWAEGDRLEKGAFDIMEPAEKKWVEPEILLVPLLAFDRHGYRLGYGGGYYDATIAALRDKKEIVTIGLSYAQQAVLFNLPREDHDQPMDWILTPHRAICHV